MKKYKRILFSLAAALCVTLLFKLPALERLDLQLQDWLYQRPGVTSPEIVVIGIDDEAFELLGPYNTWDRNIMASALEALAADPDNRPAVTAIDVLYAGNTKDQPDERLAQAAEKLGNVVTASMAEFGRIVTWENGRIAQTENSAVVNYLEPYNALRSVTTQGHINAITDDDGIMRHALLSVEPRSGPVYSMAYETARIYLEQTGQEISLPPVDSEGYIYVPFTGTPGGYSDGISIAQVIAGQVPSQYWAGKIVLIGPYAQALQDAYFTPIAKDQLMYGVEFQANVIQSFLEKNHKTDAPYIPQFVFLFLIGTAAMLLFLKLKVLPGGAVCAGLAVLTAAFPALLYRAGFVIHPIWIPLAIILLYVISLAVHYAMAAKERRELALEKERIEAELGLASKIQTNSLPKEFPPFPDRTEFDIYASMKPAKEVGGDLYDFFLIDEDHLGLVIGDVSGKGIPAALFMMVSSALLRHAAMSEKSPARTLQLVNSQICARNPEEMFVTVWLGILEISTGKLTAANAGHEYPALKKTDGRFALYKDRHGFVIGGMDGVRYRDYEILLEPGDKLFVYTDGVAEATNSAKELFGTDRMINVLQSREDGTPKEILDTVEQAVQEFAGTEPQFDDLTMLCLQYNGVR